MADLPVPCVSLEAASAAVVLSSNDEPLPLDKCKIQGK